MYRSSPFRSTLNTGYITGLDMCKVRTEAVHCAALWTSVQVQTNVIIPTPPHPTLSHVMCARVTLGGKMVQNCACVYLWLQSVCAGDSGKWLCAHVTPVCVRVTLGGKNDAKLCLRVLVTPECVRGWPPDPTQATAPVADMHWQPHHSIAPEEETSLPAAWPEAPPKAAAGTAATTATRATTANHEPKAWANKHSSTKGTRGESSSRPFGALVVLALQAKAFTDKPPITKPDFTRQSRRISDGKLMTGLGQTHRAGNLVFLA